MSQALPEVRQYLGPLPTFQQASALVLNLQDALDRSLEYGFAVMAQ